MIAKEPKKPFIWRDVVLKPGSKRFKGLPLMDPSQRSGKCRILVKDGVAVAQED